MTRATTPLAVAADYADALMTARRAKNALFLLLLLFLLAQLAFFFLGRYGVIRLGDPASAAATPLSQLAGSPDAAATQPDLSPATQPAAGRTGVDLGPIVRYVVPLINVAAVVLSIVLAVVMLLLVTIMLVGRLIGVSSVTGAFIWGVLLVALFIPWQTILITDGNYPVTGGTYPVAGSASAVTEQPAFKFPGVLYTYPELRRDHQQTFAGENIWPHAVWFWGRYVGMPVLALLLLFTIQIKSSRGLRYALGEADVHVEVTTQRQDVTVAP